MGPHTVRGRLHIARIRRRAQIRYKLVHYSQIEGAQAAADSVQPALQCGTPNADGIRCRANGGISSLWTTKDSQNRRPHALAAEIEEGTDGGLNADVGLISSLITHIRRESMFWIDAFMPVKAHSKLYLTSSSHWQVYVNTQSIQACFSICPR